MLSGNKRLCLHQYAQCAETPGDANGSVQHTFEKVKHFAKAAATARVRHVFIWALRLDFSRLSMERNHLFRSVH